MAKFFGQWSAMAYLVFLSGCVGMQLDKARSTDISGTAFTDSLSQGYLALSEAEYAESDHFDSDVFARRARNTAGGFFIAPETIDSRDLPEETIEDLTVARGRLMGALRAGAREEAPQQAAQAQVMFDCWMQEQEENFQPDDIAACREKFETAMASVDGIMGPVLAARQAAALEPAAGTVGSTGSYLVFFTFDEDRLTRETQVMLGQVIRDVKASETSRIEISAHTDRAGTEPYNDGLSLERAEAVVQYLVARGVPKSQIVATAFGEREPRVTTPDGVPEAENRRVELRFLQ